MRRSGQRSPVVVVDEQTDRGGEFMPAGFARPDMADAGLAHEFGSRRGKYEIVAIGAARKGDATRREGRAVRLGLSGHGSSSAGSPLHLPRTLACCRRSLARAWHVGEVFINSSL